MIAYQQTCSSSVAAAWTACSCIAVSSTLLAEAAAACDRNCWQYVFCSQDWATNHQHSLFVCCCNLHCRRVCV